MYKAIVTQKKILKRHIHRGDGKLSKTRYNLHNSSLRLPHKSSTTTLTEHLWKLKDASISYMIERTFLDKTKLCTSALKNVTSASRKNLLYYIFYITCLLIYLFLCVFFLLLSLILSCQLNISYFFSFFSRI